MESELDSEITGTDYSSTESDSDDNTAVSPTQLKATTNDTKAKLHKRSKSKCVSFL